MLFLYPTPCYGIFRAFSSFQTCSCISLQHTSSLRLSICSKYYFIGSETQLCCLFYFSGTNAFMSGEHREVLVVDRERVDHVTEIRATFARATSWWWSSAKTTPYSVIISKITITSAQDGRRLLFIYNIHNNNDNVDVFKIFTTNACSINLTKRKLLEQVS